MARWVSAVRSFLLGASLLTAACGCKAITARHATNGGDLGRLRTIYTAEMGIREATDNNDHPRIDEYLRYVGLGSGYAWCAAFVSFCFGEAGYPEPRNAWSPALFPEKRVIWRYSIRAALAAAPGTGVTPARTAPTPGDVFGIHYNNLRRIGHCGFVDGWGDTNCITVEGNTGPDGAVLEIGDPNNPIRAGPGKQGVYRKRRPIRTIHTVARWH